MASNGIASFLYAPLNETDGTYGEVLKFSGAVSYKETLNKSSGAVYADNIKKWEDSSVTGGKLTLGVLDDDPIIFAPLLGRKTKKVKIGDTEEKEVYIGNSEDIPQPVGFGFVEFGRDETKSFYQVNFYPKITFAPYDKEGETRKDNNDYKTPNVEGTIYNLNNGDYKNDNRFDTLQEAVKVLYALFGKTEIPEEVLKNIGIQENIPPASEATVPDKADEQNDFME